jgi:PTS system nitrogen regulatory IIA component
MQLTARDAAAILGVSEKTLYRWIDQRDIPFHKINDQICFSKAELLEWATARRIKVSEQLFRDPDRNGDELPMLSKAFEAGGVIPALKGRQKQDVLKSMVDALALPTAFDREMLFQMLLAREGLGSTGIGDGIAIPHVRNPLVLNVAQPSVTLCYLETPIDFGALDGKPVHSLFSLVSPTIKSHLHLLSRLSTALLDAGFKAALARKALRDDLLREVRRVEAGFTKPRVESP